MSRTTKRGGAMDVFNELSESLREAIDIKEGKRKPARVTTYTPTVVLEIRRQLGVTQAEFAKTLGASLESVKSWELGRRHPSGLAARVLSAMHESPDIYHLLARHSGD